MPAKRQRSGMPPGPQARQDLLGFAADEVCREMWGDEFEEIVGR